MLIFSRYNLVLLAVPKTGSTALEVALGQEADRRFGNPPELKHLPLYRYNRFVRPLLQLTTGKDPETFALIRSRLAGCAVGIGIVPATLWPDREPRPVISASINLSVTRCQMIPRLLPKSVAKRVFCHPAAMAGPSPTCFNMSKWMWPVNS